VRRREPKEHVQDAPNPERGWNWVAFVCAFLLSGVLTFFNMRMPFFRSLGLHIVETVATATVWGVLGGALGDRAFEMLAGVRR
jgi:hypothetical protein